VDTDSRYVADDVRTAVRNALAAGLLATGALGIGNPLFRSQLFEAVLKVPGTVAVEGVLWEGTPWVDFAAKPDSGYYYQFTVTV
jgi:hypothetical protein